MTAEAASAADAAETVEDPESVPGNPRSAAESVASSNVTGENLGKAARAGAAGDGTAEDPESAPGNCVVVSQTWLRAGEEHAAAYLRLAADFDRYLTARPGFVRRFLVRSLDDARHLIHWREFTSVEAYEEMTADPEYRDHIAALSRHVDADAYPAGAAAREYGRVVHATPPPPPDR